MKLLGSIFFSICVASISYGKAFIPCEDQINNVLQVAEQPGLDSASGYNFLKDNSIYSYQGFSESKVNLREFENNMEKIQALTKREKELKAQYDRSEFFHLNSEYHEKISELSKVVDICKENDVCTKLAVEGAAKKLSENKNSLAELNDKFSLTTRELQQIPGEIQVLKKKLKAVDFSIRSKNYDFETNYGNGEARKLSDKMRALDQKILKLEESREIISRTSSLPDLKNIREKIDAKIKEHSEAAGDLAVQYFKIMKMKPGIEINFHYGEVYVRTVGNNGQRSTLGVIDLASCKFLDETNQPSGSLFEAMGCKSNNSKKPRKQTQYTEVACKNAGKMENNVKATPATKSNGVDN